MSGDKAPGSTSIPREMYAAGGQQFRRKLTKLYQPIWNQEEILQDIKDDLTIYL